MALTPMDPGGRWMKPPTEGVPVYIPSKQVDAHFKRLVGDNWIPIDDPRVDDGVPPTLSAELPLTVREVGMQAQIDQLTALVKQLIAHQQKEQHDGSTPNDGISDTESPTDDRRSGRRKPAV